MNLSLLEKIATTASIITALAVVAVVWAKFGLLPATATAMVLTWTGTIVVFQAADTLEGRRARTTYRPPDKFVSPDE